MKEKENDKLNQVMQVGGLLFIISIVLIIILTAYTIINTKSVDKLVKRVDEIEEKLNGNGSYGDPEPVNGYSTEEFKTIMPSDIKKESKNETIVVLWARQSCGYCVAYAPILTEVAREHNVTIRYINMEELVDLTTWEPSNPKEYNILANLDGEGEWSTFAKEAIEGTPGTFFIKNNKVVYGIIGYTEKETVEKAFKSVGL